jgi:hypothetical protein
VVLHWLAAAAILILLGHGWWMTHEMLPRSPGRLASFRVVDGLQPGGPQLSQSRLFAAALDPPRRGGHFAAKEQRVPGWY